MKTHRPSALELQLKRLIHHHPEAVVHPHSPCGPHVRAVMWHAAGDEQILGQVFWDTDANSWTVRAVDLALAEPWVVTEHPEDMNALSVAITRVIDAVAAARDPLDALPEGVAETLRSLRDGS